MEFPKDKKRIAIEDLLNSYKDGLSIQDIIDKTGLARHTILARLHRLEGEKKVRVRQVNMARLYYWNEQPSVSIAPRPESQEKTKENIILTELKEEHFSKAPPQALLTAMERLLLEAPAKTTPAKMKAEIKAAPPPKPDFDPKAIKEQIENEFRQGDLKKHEAELLKQRAPAAHVLENANHKETQKADEFLKTGIPGFDALFEHGIPKGNSVLVAGGAGSGKTIFCLQTVYQHALEGEKCLYMSFEESEERLIHHMEDFGWHPWELIKKGNLIIKRFNPFDITRQVDALLLKAKGELLIDVEPIIFPEHFIPSVLVLDSLTAIASAFTEKEDSYRVYIEQLFRFFEQIKATSLLITETEQIPKIFSTKGVEEFLADGVIVLYAIKRGNVRENAIEVLKMRGEKHQKKIVAMQISDAGITVFPEQEVFGGVEEK